MQAISGEDIARRVRAENPWWGEDHVIPEALRNMKPRAYFALFFPLVKSRDIRRAVILMGPRRVGKTVMIHHAVQALIEEGVRPQNICYVSVDNPVYNGVSIDKFLQHYKQSSGVDYNSEQVFIFLDEIQYLRHWEVDLKSAVDTHSNVKFIASGSAAAALKLKSSESGAGRFTDFLLPPLTFYEYLDLLGKTGLVSQPTNGSVHAFFTAANIEELNGLFIHYLNYGGYPEVIFNPQIQADPARFIKSDIIDKVLLRDLPSLYGIQNIPELNYLFTTLAFNTARELSLAELSQNSGVARNTIKRYIDYLEAAFLIKIVHRVDHNAKRFERANFFKVYLTNPSMRAALFSPVNKDDDVVPYLAETAIYSQWFHSMSANLKYARWANGEVDIVSLNHRQKCAWAVEVKWSDRFCDSPQELKSLLYFCHKTGLDDVLVTSKTRTTERSVNGIDIPFIPASIYCYTVGYNIIHGRIDRTLKQQIKAEPADGEGESDKNEKNDKNE